MKHSPKLLIFIPLMGCLSLFAQPFKMVKQINSTATLSSYASSSYGKIGDIFFFAANDGIHGVELWKSDGTEAGTVMVKDIAPGGLGSGISLITEAGSHVYFVANDGVNGLELWKSDGTAAGTILVKDINPTAGFGSSIVQIFYHNGLIFFPANNGINGVELWKSDGTVTGTVLVKDIHEGSANGLFNTTSPNYFSALGNEVYFAANTSTSGWELWKTDGSAEGTVQVKDINAGSASSIGNIKMASWNGKVYFSANDGTTGSELWATNGSETGTYRVKDIEAGSLGSAPNNLIVFQNKLYFSAGNFSNLWKSDGSEAGTNLVANLSSLGISLYSGESFRTNQFTVVGENLFFTGSSTGYGEELFVSNGPFGGASLVKDIFPGTGSASPIALTPFNDKLYFAANSGFGINQLFVTDGTINGTQMLSEQFREVEYSFTGTSMLSKGDKLFFSSSTLQLGSELWISDGSDTGTLLLKDINKKLIGASLQGNTLGTTEVMNGEYYFVAMDDSLGLELWKSDGTPNGTILVKDIYPGVGSSRPSNLKTVGGYIYFTANDGVHGYELWRTDGTPEGTILVEDINPGPQSSFPSTFVVSGNYLYYTASAPDLILFWTEINTGETKVPYGNFYFGPIQSSITVGNSAYIVSLANQKLYKADGPTIAEFSNSIITATDLGAIGDTLYFGGRTTGNQTGLWRSINGAPPELVKLISTSFVNLYQFANCNGKLYFNAFTSTTGYEPWVSDGTEGGTYLIKDIVPGTGSSQPFQFTQAGNKVYFYARSINNGNAELWATDGTSTGTYLVKDINPGNPSSNPAGIVSVSNDNVLFTANDGINGIQLWQSDGTSEGTKIAQQFNNAGDAFNALSYALYLKQDYQFRKINNGIIFFAFSADKGFQLYFGKPESAAYYVNDQNTNGDFFTTAAGSNNNSGNKDAPFETLDFALTKVQNGDTIYVDAGLYDFSSNSIVVNKGITILGSNYQVNPNKDEDQSLPNDSRHAEAILKGLTIHLTTSFNKINGFTFEPGENQAIVVNDTSISNLEFTNNIFRVTSTTFSVKTIDIRVKGDIIINKNRFVKEVDFANRTLFVHRAEGLKIEENSFVQMNSDTSDHYPVHLGGETSNELDFIKNAVIKKNYFKTFRTALTIPRISHSVIEDNYMEDGYEYGIYSNSDIFHLDSLQIINNRFKGVISPITIRSQYNQSNATINNLEIRNNEIDFDVANNIKLGFNAQIWPLIEINLVKRSKPHGIVKVGNNKLNIYGSYANATNTSKYGIYLEGPIKNTYIHNNELNYNVTGEALIPGNDFSHSSGIILASDMEEINKALDPLSSIYILNNKVNGFYNSVAVFDVTNYGNLPDSGYGYLPGGIAVNINNNSFMNSTVAINNGGKSQVINGGCNWFGSTNEAIVATKVSSKTVRYVPYLMNEIDNEESIGFQPSASGCAFIQSFEPPQGMAGEVIHVKGGGFLSSTGISFNGALGDNLNILSDSTLAVTVPVAAQTGIVSLTKPQGNVISTNNFFVIPPIESDTIGICPRSNGIIISNIKGTSYQWQVYQNDDFINISNGFEFNDVQKDTLRLLNIDAEKNGLILRCKVDGSTESKSFILRVANYWTGIGNSNDWNEPMNWGCSGQIPDQNTNVYIKSGNVVLTENTTVKSIFVNPSATLSVQPGIQLNIKPN